MVFEATKAQEVDGDFDGEVAAIFRPVDRLGREALELFDLFPVGRPIRPLERDIHIVDRDRQELFARVSEVITCGVVHIAQLTVGGDPKDRVGRAVDGELGELEASPRAVSSR